MYYNVLDLCNWTNEQMVDIQSFCVIIGLINSSFSLDKRFI